MLIASDWFYSYYLLQIEGWYFCVEGKGKGCLIKKEKEKVKVKDAKIRCWKRVLAVRGSKAIFTRASPLLKC